MIVLLRNQHPEAPGLPGAQAQRTSALVGDQSPIVSELSAVRAPRIHRFAFVNAIAATVSKAEAQRLAGNPAVAAVVPDALVRGPAPTPAPAGAGPAPAAASPAAGVCPTAGRAAARARGAPDDERRFRRRRGAARRARLRDGQGGQDRGLPRRARPADPRLPSRRRNAGDFDYVDFSGEGLGAPTGGGGAFGDATR
ncbi:MAG: hypothetical protein ACR2KV_00495 [Solirubrobacteraceae bacterium]